MIPHFAQAIFGEMAGMSGVFISSIFSASLSTTSTTLNSQAGVIYSDFIRPLNIIRHSERNANYCMKLAIFVMGTFSILGGVAIEKLGSLFQAVYTLSGICAGPIVGVFTLGMLFPCANRHVSTPACRLYTELINSFVGSSVWPLDWNDKYRMFDHQYSSGHFNWSIARRDAANVCRWMLGQFGHGDFQKYNDVSLPSIPFMCRFRTPTQSMFPQNSGWRIRILQDFLHVVRAHWTSLDLDQWPCHFFLHWMAGS